MSYTYKYPHPAVTADILVFARDGHDIQLLLIERGREPYAGSWAFPGGFMSIDETTAQAAVRELREETGINITENELHRIDIYDAVGRDPRERVITVAYYTIIDNPAKVQGGDDAKRAQWFSLSQLPPLAFDHAEILKKARTLLSHL